ncbi:zinc finger protein 708-like [Planococcus citri]|uniref:zinc finger protein 708-like n=1 Tax=Planococcus citri TaxID=170843 RepID=UPI0031F734CC
MISVDTILKNVDDLTKLEDLCRMCGKNQKSFTPIFDETNRTNRYNYYKVIQQHFGDKLQISNTDVLPSKMCSKCLKLMMSWHEFYLECLKVEKKFKRLIDKLSSTKDPEKKTSATVNNVELIEVDDDAETSDVFKENTNDFDISNVNVEESTTFVDINDFSDLDDSDSSNTSDLESEMTETTKTAHTTNNHSESAGDYKNPSSSLQRRIKKKKSTVCRICGKLYTNRGTYLTHLQKVHSSKRGTKSARRPRPLEKKQDVDQQKQQESQQLPAQPPPAPSPKKPAPKKQTNDAAVPCVCHVCGKMLKNNSCLKAHLRFVHPSNPEAVKKPPAPPQMCELCGKICTVRFFKAHMLKHANPDSVTCQHCGKVFSYKSTLESHIKVCHSDDRAFKCTECPSSFRRGDYLRKHISYKHHDIKLDDIFKFKCEHCDMVWTTEKNYLTHMKTYSDGRCAKPKPKPKFTRNRSVNSNAKADATEVTSDDTMKYWCEICDLSFKKRNYYLLHERYVHVKKKPYSISENAEGQFICDQCDKRFSSISGRKYHCKTVHGKEFDGSFNATCDHCGLAFRNRVFYAKHRAKLNGMPTCYLCWKQFTTDEELTKHIDVDHLSDLPFVCEICKARFVALKNLEYHIRTKHLNDRPFKCHLCDHSASRKDSLAIHIRGTHLGMRPYQCEICGQKFSQQNDWRKHTIRHKTK